ncbi:MOP flippase family protein [Oculatella sp. FACHB-28]|uniref:MOP flippase family protein n=1 Tax=Oculatella sp. FACHB-28 TaxID=2692845 RepID=UPI001682137B|nr:MOP flippase family protein [Oculatella sp. FACHB-28]MBD2059305.1 MOP flippase family protein [Oculatella sp. FACHB-28]
MSIKQKAIKGVVWSAIQSWSSQAGSLIVFLVLARLLSPEAFGLVALANIFLAFMQIFLNQGFAQVIVQRQNLEPEHLDTAFWTNLAIGILLTVLGLTTADRVAALFNQPQLTPIVQGFSLLFLVTSFGNIQQALLERNLAFRAIAIRWLVGTLAGGCVGVIMAVYGFGVWSLVSQQLVQDLVGTLILWVASDWRPRFKASLKHFQQLCSFGISILGFNLLNFLNTRADDFLIGYFLGSVALGYYTIAYRILGVMTQLLVNTSNQVALPTFSRLQEEPELFRKAFYTATQLTSLVAFPTFLGVATLAPELVVLLFGNQWLPSISVLQILCFAGMLRAINFFKGSVFIAMGKPAWTLWFGLLNTTVNLVGFAISVQWGIVAVASAYAIRGYLIFPINQWAVSRLIRTPMLTYLSQFTAPLVSSLVMAGFILGSKQLLQNSLNSQVLLVVCILLGAMVYSLSIRLLSPKLFEKLLSILHLALSKTKSQGA